MLCTSIYHLKRRGVKNEEVANLEEQVSDLNQQLASSHATVALRENQCAWHGGGDQREGEGATIGKQGEGVLEWELSAAREIVSMLETTTITTFTNLSSNIKEIADNALQHGHSFFCP